eukprot:g7284.t1
MSPPTPSTSSSAPQYKTRLDSGDVSVSFAAGFTAGFIVKTATAPLSRMTILLQVDSLGASSSSASARKMFFDVVQNEGLASFWRGNWTSILQKGISTGINYVFFEAAKQGLKQCGGWKSETDVGFGARTCAGFLGGAMSLLLSYPFDVVRTRLACDPSLGKLSGRGGGAACGAGPGPPASCGASAAATASGLEGLLGRSVILRVWTDLVRREGSLFRACSRGLPCTLLCQGLNMGIGFGIYETLNVDYTGIRTTTYS